MHDVLDAQWQMDNMQDGEIVIEITLFFWHIIIYNVDLTSVCFQ